MTRSIEDEVSAVVELFRGRLPGAFLDEYQNLVRHNECTIGFENLCVQLYEVDIFPSTAEFREIQRVGARLGLKVQSWDFLQPKGGF